MATTAEQIKERLDIVEILGTYIKLEKAGINYKAKCPFHNEKTASFFVSPGRQSFYCFGCQVGGDIFSFVEKFEGLDFRGALKILADKAGISLSDFRDEKSEQEKEKLLQMMEQATKFYELKYKENSKTKKYMASRGLEEPFTTKWRVGFAPDAWRSLFEYLSKENFTKQEMLRVGLIKKTEKEEKYYDTFRDRIMFPISDNAGRVIAFSGRTMKKDDQTPKYLNSPETEFFHKSEVLYGFHLAKNFIRKLDYAVVVEGQLDLLLSHKAGVGNTVASSGTALSEKHLTKIIKLTNRIIMAYDADRAGQNAGIKAAEIALSLGMEVKVAELPAGEDPASIIKNNTKKWKDILRNSVHLIDFSLNKIMKEKKDNALIKEVGQSVLPYIKLLKNELEKSYFVKRIASKIGVKEDAIWADLNKISNITEERLATKDHILKTSPEKILIGIIFLEEGRSPQKADKLKKKFIAIMGPDAEKMLVFYENEKESLIFEIERILSSEDTEKITDEIIKRIELAKLKAEFLRATSDLDKKEKEDQNKIRKKIEQISKKIEEIGID